MSRLPLFACRAGLAALLAASVATAAATAPAIADPLAAPDASFLPYQVILDRAIFGKPPARAAAAPVADEGAAQKQQAEALARKLTMCAVNRTPSGLTAVGFIDNEAKPARNIYLYVGDSSDGYTILAADYDAETATIEKDGVVITLKLGAGLVATAVPTAAPAAAAADRGTRPGARPQAGEAAHAVRTGSIRRPSQAGMPPMPSVPAIYREQMEQTREAIEKIREEGGDVRSYMDQLRERRAQERAEKVAAENAARETLQQLARQITEDELRKQERQINLSLIEQGARPLSDIELTPEEEAALLEKGVL